MDGTKQKPGKNLTQRYIEQCIFSGKFYSRAVAQSGRPFFIFREYGDQLSGQLVSGPHDNSHLNRTRSYVIEVIEKIEGNEYSQHPNRIYEEFFANRQLHSVINRDKLLHKFVRIVFVGRMKGYKGHNAKVYAVFEDIGVITSKEVARSYGIQRDGVHQPTDPEVE